ncbi:MAG TPA: PRC-barrel domain-containing protein [Micrococcaceae bacterium]|nr:PRC-barrel domain-containing protein [Micrococcaceae bacterium]
MIDADQVKKLIQSEGNVRTFEGEKIGTFGQFYLDDDSGWPNWVTVRTGFFGNSESFVPLAETAVEGSDLLVPYPKDLVKDAPRIEHDGDLSPEEEDRLYRHYQLQPDSGTADGVQTSWAATPASGTVGEPTMAASAPEESPTTAAGPAAGRVRLRRYTVIEDITPTGTGESELGDR